MAVKRDHIRRFVGPVIGGQRDLTQLHRTLGSLDIGRIAGTSAVVRPVSTFESYLRPARAVVGMEPLRLSSAVYGLASERQSTLYTAFGAEATSRMVSQFVGKGNAFADEASRSLAAMTGAHMRADIAGTLAGALGFDEKQRARLRTVLAGASASQQRGAAWRTFSEHPYFGENARRNLTRWIDALQPSLNEMAQRAMRFVELRQELDEGAVAFVERHGWPLPLALPMTVLHRVVRLAKRPKREVSATMLETFGPRTRAFRQSRDALMDSMPFEGRRPAVEQAVRAMRRGDQYAAICTMLPLVEGVLVDVIFGGQEAPRGQVTQKALVELGNVGDLEDAWITRSIETLLLSATGGVALFDHFDRRDYGVPGESRRLNRHAILHGSARRYGTRENSLKLFLLLVALAEVLNDYPRGAAAAGQAVIAA
jgi:hypothetical protein